MISSWHPGTRTSMVPDTASPESFPVSNSGSAAASPPLRFSRVPSSTIEHPLLGMTARPAAEADVRQRPSRFRVWVRGGAVRSGPGVPVGCRYFEKKAEGPHKTREVGVAHGVVVVGEAAGGLAGGEA